MKLLFFVALIVSPFFAWSQKSVPDSILIQQACENYVGGFYNSDTVRIIQALHPDLVKRIVAKKMDYKLVTSGTQDLIRAAKNNHPNDNNPQEPFKVTVLIYDIAYDIATAKIMTNKMNFIDYAQLAKIKGEWKIINVLWAFK